VTLLTEAERDCLRLVFQHMTSKDIARQLGVSPHTVDMRLRQAIRKLEVTNRIEAARALVHTEILLGIAQPVADNATGDAYQELIYQASEIADDAKSATIGAPASQEPGAASNRSSDPQGRCIQILASWMLVHQVAPSPNQLHHQAISLRRSLQRIGRALQPPTLALVPGHSTPHRFTRHGRGVRRMISGSAKGLAGSWGSPWPLRSAWAAFSLPWLH
jgi:DNA-binding CsgD family transcriptional regulator